MISNIKIQLSHLFNSDKEIILEQVNEMSSTFADSAQEIRGYIEISSDHTLKSISEVDDKKMLIKVLLCMAYSSIDEFTFSALRERYNENINSTCNSFGLHRHEIITLTSHVEPIVNLLNKKA